MVVLFPVCLVRKSLLQKIRGPFLGKKKKKTKKRRDEIEKIQRKTFNNPH